MALAKEVSDKEFDSIYFNIATNIAASNFPKAIHLSDSLVTSTIDPQRKLKSIMLKSKLYQQNRNIKSAIESAQEALKIAIESKNYVWQSRIYGFLATQYRILRLYDIGLDYLDKGQAIAKKVKIPQERITYQGLIYQEKAYYALEENDYESAIISYLEAEKFFSNIINDRNRTYFLANNNEFLARTYLSMNNFNKATFYYSKTAEYVYSDENKNDVFNAFLYYGLGTIEIHNENYKMALEHLTNADEIADKSQTTDLQLLIYKSFSILYKKINDLEKFDEYNDKYINLNSDIEAKRDSIIRDFINQNKEKEITLTKKNHLLIIGVIISIVAFLIAYILISISRRKQKKRFFQIINDLREHKIIHPVRNSQDEFVLSSNKEEIDQSNSMQIPEETKKHILDRINKLTKTTKYLNRDFGLTQLSEYIKANTKYVSLVINHELNMNVNTFINTLRINYIIKKLESDEKYRQYSISYLSEECGFSSHSKFSQVFKEIVGMSPSVFIKELNK